MTMYPPRVAVPVYAVFTGIAVFLTGLRFWARIHYTKGKPGRDDWFAAIGVFIICACAGIQFFNAYFGTGGEAIRPEDAEARAIASKKVDFSMVLIEKPAFGAIKLCLLFFYRRVFGVWGSFKTAYKVIAGIIVAWVIAFVVADLSICGDKLDYYFMLDQTLAKEHCADKGVLLLMFAITSVLTDILVLGLPFIYLRRLQMPPQKKWATGIVLFLGFVATAAGVLRTIFLGIAVPMGRLDYGYEPEGEEPLVLRVFNPTFWVMMEMLLGAWACNLPPLGPLLGAMGFRELVSRAYEKVSTVSSSFSSSNKSRRASSNAGIVWPKNSDSSLSSGGRSRPSYAGSHARPSNAGSHPRGSNGDQWPPMRTNFESPPPPLPQGAADQQWNHVQWQPRGPDAV